MYVNNSDRNCLAQLRIEHWPVHAVCAFFAVQQKKLGFWLYWRNVWIFYVWKLLYPVSCDIVCYWLNKNPNNSEHAVSTCHTDSCLSDSHSYTREVVVAEYCIFKKVVVVNVAFAIELELMRRYVQFGLMPVQLI